MPMTDGRSFSFQKLLPESWNKKLVYKLHTQPSKFFCTRNMADDGDDDLAVAATIVLSALNDVDL